MAAEPIKLNLAQKKAIKEADAGSQMKESLDAITAAMGKPTTFEWTVEQNLTALAGTKGDEYKENIIKFINEKYLKSLATNFKYHCGQDAVFVEELKKIWTTGKITFTILPVDWKPTASDIALKSREHGQNGIRIVDGNLDIWTPANQFNCGPDLLETCEWKMYQLFDNVPHDGVSVKAKMDIAKYNEKIEKLVKELKELGAPAETKFNPEADFKTCDAAKPTTAPVTIDKIFQYYEYLVASLRNNGMKDADVKEAILDVWKGPIRMEIVESLAGVAGTKEVNTYNGVKFDGETLVILIEKQRWACAIDNLQRCDWVKLF